MRRTILTAAVALFALAGCGSSGAATAAKTSAKPAPHSLTVVFTLNDVADGVYCDTGGLGGFADIGPDSPITVYNGSGSVIATGQLGTECTQPESTNQTATWTAHVTVPDSAFYQVEVSHRGKLAFSKADLDGKAWTITTSLG